MNPFTRSLLKQLDNRRLHRFVAGWDQLEALIIQIYKSRAASPEEEAAYQKIKTWLIKHYPVWKPRLSKYWPETQAGGEPLDADPFETLFSIQGGNQIPGNWRAMQILPAAREAINQFLLDEIGGL